MRRLSDRRWYLVLFIFITLYGFMNGKQVPMSSTTGVSLMFKTIADKRVIRSISVSGGKIASSEPKGKAKYKAVTTYFATLKEKVREIEPVTRSYALLIVICSLVHIMGLPAPALLSLDITRIYEIWRPFTATSYFGAPSLSLANSLYFLVVYGQLLEKRLGSGEFGWFLATQVVTLTTLSLLMGFPFQSHAMIAAIVYISSRVSPLEKMVFQFGFVIAAWQLPYCLMLMDCLMQQSPAAAWPHFMGILSGHTYYFLREVWPVLGGRDWLQTPSAFVRKQGVSSIRSPRKVSPVTRSGRTLGDPDMD